METTIQRRKVGKPRKALQIDDSLASKAEELLGYKAIGEAKTASYSETSSVKKFCGCGAELRCWRKYLNGGPRGWRWAKKCDRCKRYTSRKWKKEEVEWAGMMWAHGISLIRIGQMLRRLSGSVEGALKRRGLYDVTRTVIRRHGRIVKRHSKPRLRHSHGYIILLRPDHPNVNNSGYVYEHRVVMAEKLGRPLKDGEAVHHINGIRDDNRPENLEVFESHSAHMVEHQAEREKWTPEMDAEMFALRQKGVSARLIGEGLGFSSHGVLNRVRRLRKRGVDVPPASKGRWAGYEKKTAGQRGGFSERKSSNRLAGQRVPLPGPL